MAPLPPAKLAPVPVAEDVYVVVQGGTRTLGVEFHGAFIAPRCAQPTTRAEGGQSDNARQTYILLYDRCLRFEYTIF